ncbi:glycine cleavage system aminomethyltransferase GcvT [bacterium]|nr:glycine cleavage system aminomethyltransferase GcvT [bacterium]
MTIVRTPFYQKHIEAGAKIVDFAGYKMPMFYKGIVPEHLRVRASAGLFDLSHMGEFFLEGKGALDFISKTTTNDPSSLGIGQCQYSAMCYDNGGIVDDLLIYRLDEESWMLVVNASNLQKDWEWLNNHVPSNPDFTFENRSEKIGLLAIQGPDAQKIFQKLTDYNLEAMQFYCNGRANIGGHDNVLFSRTGYTGEDGFELYLEPSICLDLWKKFVQAGAEFNIEPIGLGARDSLRLEMKYALYGNDIDQTTNPWEANLGWIIKLEKGNFIGRDALIDIKTKGIGRKLICFKLAERGFPRHNYPIVIGADEIGVVTSGTHSPSLDMGVGMGYVKKEFAKIGTEIQIIIRNHPIKAIIEKPPLYKGGSHR